MLAMSVLFSMAVLLGGLFEFQPPDVFNRPNKTKPFMETNSQFEIIDVKRFICFCHFLRFQCFFLFFQSF